MSILKNIKADDSEEAVNTALALQEACAKIGFDWKTIGPVFDKVSEELDEIKEALQNPNKNKDDVEDELGDLFFACINLARHLSLNPHTSLQTANQKFKRRFEVLEALLEESQPEKGPKKTLQEMSLDELEQLWQAAKRKKS